ncbi:hypothetical protein [Paracoccus liaowanqingii]|uniref:hypothetical protein n=1 Tax=Paracoccus liaowanqingii TaxID=2560053 RepID=UPI00143CF365|nr:hypothetical protein [Paracoccus liaowanqingii]
MSEEKPETPRVFIVDGYQPSLATRGYQAVTFESKPQGGHQPATSQAPTKLPSGGSSES